MGKGRKREQNLVSCRGFRESADKGREHPALIWKYAGVRTNLGLRDSNGDMPPHSGAHVTVLARVRGLIPGLLLKESMFGVPRFDIRSGESFDTLHLREAKQSRRMPYMPASVP